MFSVSAVGVFCHIHDVVTGRNADLSSGLSVRFPATMTPFLRSSKYAATYSGRATCGHLRSTRLEKLSVEKIDTRAAESTN